MEKSIESGLNAAQKQAVTSQAQQLLVLAGPGTGKTRLIIAKILHLLEKGVKPERILGVTFSRKASWEMQERLLAHKPEFAERVEISTLHAFCVDLVQRHGFRLGLGRKLDLITEAQAQLLFRRLAPRLPFQHFVKSSAIDSVISDLLSFFQDCKDEGLWPEQVLSYAQSLPEESEDDRSIKQEWIALGDIYNAYQDHCFQEGYLDFGDAVLGALRLLDDYPIVAREVQAAYDYVLVDEFQDTNWTQIRLLRQICGPSTKICVVGDDDQAIYRFRGASFSAFTFFSEMFPEPEVVELSETYRLPPSVAAAASCLIQQNGERRFRPNKILKSLQDSNEPVKIIEAPDYEEEANFVATAIEESIKSGTPISEHGILVRAHSHAELVISALDRRGIPVEASSSQSIFENEIVQDALALLRLIVQPGDNISFLRLMDSAFLRLGSSDIVEFCKASRFGKNSYFESLKQLDSYDLSDEAKLSLRNFHQCFEELFASSAKQRASVVLLTALESLKVVQHLMNEKKTSELHDLIEFLNKLSEWERLQADSNLQRNFSLLEALSSQSLLLPEEEGDDASRQAVKVLSVHASKGLEFENVFVLSLVGRRFPANFRSNTWLLPNDIRKEPAPTKESHIDEERRLLYVAMTRAKSNLYLSSILRKGTRPSIFLSQDIEKNLEPKYFRKIQIESKTDISERLKAIKPVFSRISEPEVSMAPKKKESLKLSYTQLEKYERCPLSYWFSYELGVPSPPNPSLITGSAVHEALENFYRKVQNDQTPTKEDLLSYFETSFARLQNEIGSVGEENLQLGKSKLSDFYDHQEGQFHKPLAIEKDFQFKVGQHLIRGKIDRVDESEDGVRIIDYKTGKSKSDLKPEDRKFAKESLQFSIYALAAKNCFSWKVKELCFYYIYDNEILRTQRAEEDLLQTEEKILQTADSIVSQKFEATPGFHCRYCEFSKVCPSAQI